jgi:hypothetical protein
MYLKAIIIRTPSDLERETWTFSLINATIVLDSYALTQRATPRHRKYQPVKTYHRNEPRHSTLALIDVPLPGDVILQARHDIIEQITVSKELPR